ncbi:MAG: hypothetical protein ACFFB7_06345, partial [Candidatus Sifarchaeia archaeon]
MALFGVVYHENVNNWATSSLVEAMKAKGHEAMSFRLPDVSAELPNRFTHLDGEDISDMNGVLVR